jgi:hypothetical protein
MIDETTNRPKGCYFDVYGWDEEKLETLTCKNCPLPAMVCDYKGLAVMEELAKKMTTSKVVVVSDP